VFLVWLLSTLLYSVLDTVLSVLTAVTGHTRSWVNVFDDSFDLQYCIRDLQLSSVGGRKQTGVGDVMQTPDRLFPYDLHAYAGFTPTLTPLDVATAFFAKLGYEEMPTVEEVWSQWGFDTAVDDCVYDSREAGLSQAYADVVFQSRAFIFHYKKAAVVCFRGTYPTAAVQWLTDLAAEQIEFPGQTQTDDRQTVRVHRGFFTALGLPIIGDPNYPETLFTQILRKLNELKEVEHVFITGHSLGGALACMFSFALKSDLTRSLCPVVKVEPHAALSSSSSSSAFTSVSVPQPRRLPLRRYNIRTGTSTPVDVPARPAHLTAMASLHTAAAAAGTERGVGRAEALPAVLKSWMESIHSKVRGVYTIGSPRVGNDGFANHFDLLYKDIPVHRFINQGDIIPHLPPPLSGSSSPDAVITFDYAHVDGLRFIDGTQRVPFVVNQDAPPTPWLSLNIFDHNPGSYVRHINSALNAQMRDMLAIKIFNRLHLPQPRA
jgi:Lipase (class 3)